ncbi:MBL fold metallo-hydrolase [Aquabacterium sp. A3]|uniref:MBL fold metallo-hydrolase n=1 Tax=Aquabacterium sp. A3 TaxID=3132829 RepID=UPI00311A9193
MSTSSAHPTLSYPWGDHRPSTGSFTTLLPGLHWVRMPLPFALNHINLWVLDDDLDGQVGLSVVDSGVATEEIRAAWEALWSTAWTPQPLLRMVVTHMHPDHVGNAHWLMENFGRSQGAQFWMSATDHLAALLACKETTGYGGVRASAHFAAHGLADPQALSKIQARGDYYASMVPDVPRSFHRLMDGHVLRMGGRQWRCLSGHGHSPEHISLYDERDGVLISGDMLLPTISTNVSVVDMEPEADPLGLFLRSLERMRDLPPDTLALPSHGLPFRGIHARINALQAHHAERLTDVVTHARQAPVCAADLLPVLFKRPLDLHQTTFAMGEALAHLNHLWLKGELRRERDDQGVWRFTAAR